MRVVLSIALLFTARFGIAALGSQHREADYAWQQWLGAWILDAHTLPRALGHETFTAAGSPWVAQEWLFSTLLTLAIRAHAFPLFAFTIALGAGAALVMVAARARALGASWPSIWIVTLLTGLAMEQMFGVRAQVSVWPLFALLLLLLEFENLRRYAVLVTLLWANVHASVFLAPLAVAVRLPNLPLLVAACALVTLVTPFGVGLPLYAVHLLGSPIRHVIDEWRSPHLSDISLGLGLLPIVVAAVGAMVLDRRNLKRDLPFVAFFTLFGLAAVRNIPIAAMALAPLAARAITPVLHDRLRVLTLLRERAVTIVGAVAVCASIVALGIRSEAMADWQMRKLPEGQIARVAELPGTRHLYCEDFAWCSLALKYPRVRTFLDGRCDPFPLPVWNAYEAIHSSRERRDDLLNRYGVDTVVAESNGKLARALRTDRSWRVVLDGKQFALFARD